jgi:hypothetical protein
MLIGSLPHTSHQQAVQDILRHTPEYPIWPQLPSNPQEGMIRQYLSGFPGIVEQDDRLTIDCTKPEYEQELLEFYEEYLAVAEDLTALSNSRFSLSHRDAGGFFALLDGLRQDGGHLGVKGQTTGPITFCTALVDQGGRAIYYDEQLRDAAIKHLGMKAAWQVKEMSRYCSRPLMIFDEPGLAGLGTSAFITITGEEIVAALQEVTSVVREQGGITGIHVCANTEWPVIFESGVEIVSFDAFSYFDRIILFKKELVTFFARGGVLASGIVPTTSEHLQDITAQQLVDSWFTQLEALCALGIDRDQIFSQSLITPSCGAGTLNGDEAEKVMQLTASVSQRIRENFPG